MHEVRFHNVYCVALHATLPPATAMTASAKIAWRGDNEYFSDSREHEHAQRIIDHRFIVYWHQLLGSGQSQRVKPSAAAAGKNYTFHKEGSKLSGSRVPVNRAQPALSQILAGTLGLDELV